MDEFESGWCKADLRGKVLRGDDHAVLPGADENTVLPRPGG